MAEFGLFIGWGSSRAGKEAAAATLFEEAVAYWNRIEASGEIESVETVLLSAHGADLTGFFLLRGDPERLGRLSMSPEFRRLMYRAGAVVEGLGIIPATLDAGAVRLVGEATEATADLI